MTSVLYEAVGGEPAVAALVEGLYERLLSDAAVKHHFAPDRMDALKESQVRWFTACLKGSELPADLAEVHANLHISDEQVAAVVGHLDALLGDLGVDRRTRRAIVSVVSRLWYGRQF